MLVCTGILLTTCFNRIIRFSHNILLVFVLQGLIYMFFLNAEYNRARVSDDVHGQHGWIHVRQSVHNPNIAVNIQSSIVGGCQAIAKALRDQYVELPYLRS